MLSKKPPDRVVSSSHRKSDSVSSLLRPLSSRINHRFFDSSSKRQVSEADVMASIIESGQELFRSPFRKG